MNNELYNLIQVHTIGAELREDITMYLATDPITDCDVTGAIRQKAGVRRPCYQTRVWGWDAGSNPTFRTRGGILAKQHY